MYNLKKKKSEEDLSNPSSTRSIYKAKGQLAQYCADGLEIGLSIVSRKLYQTFKWFLENFTRPFNSFYVENFTRSAVSLNYCRDGMLSQYL